MAGETSGSTHEVARNIGHGSRSSSRSSSPNVSVTGVNANNTTTSTNSSGKKTNCGDCTKEVKTRDKAVECEICLVWFHTKCGNVSDTLYKVLQEEPDNCHWYCKNCSRGAKTIYLSMVSLRSTMEDIQSELLGIHSDLNTLKSDVNSIEEESRETKREARETRRAVERLQFNEEAKELCVSRLEKRLETLENRPSRDITRIESRLDVLENRPNIEITQESTLVDKVIEKTADLVNKHMSEKEDQESRRMNLVIFNFPESGTKKQDIDKVSEMFKEEFNLVIKPIDAKRVGRPNADKIKLLKITMPSTSERKQILIKAKELRDSTNDVYKKCYIRPDLTKLQLEESKKLREELTLRREAQPDRKWIIKRNRITQVKEPGNQEHNTVQATD